MMRSTTKGGWSQVTIAVLTVCFAVLAAGCDASEPGDTALDEGEGSTADADTREGSSTEVMATSMHAGIRFHQ